VNVLSFAVVSRSKCVCPNLYRIAALLVLLACSQLAAAQQTLGSINGTVTDSTGAVLPQAKVRIRNLSTNLSVTAESKADGSYNIADLPVGTYQVTFTKDGFQTQVYPQISINGNRTTTLTAALKPGAVNATVTVEATPLLNQTDTTVGYTVNQLQINNTPLATGSFTQLAVLSPGVSADFLNTAGSNAGLGNQAIWANGQRDTSNSFTINGIYANNIFNGKSTSQVTSSRVAVNIGENGNGDNPSGEIATSTTVYGAIGQALPSPPPETIEEMHVNASMYDASQGANSGAQIELTTKSGTNRFHGGAYEYHEQTGWNANEWFFNHNALERPQMHRNVFGAYLGGPIIKNKLFFFGSYQGQRVTDQLLATSLVAVPPGLTNDNRTAQGLADLANTDFGTSLTAADISDQALKIMSTKAPDGSYWVPNAATGAELATLQDQNADAIVQGPTSRFTADQINANVDYNFGAKDRLAGKYYFQRDPNTTPFAQSQLLGFPQTMRAGGQVVSIDNTTALTPNLTWGQRLGFIREIAYSNTSQFLDPSGVDMSIVGTNLFPQLTIKNMDGLYDTTGVGPTTNFANAGIFQNNFEGATNVKWVNGRHSIATGIDFDDTQLNVINKNNEVARLSFSSFPGFLQGQICGPLTSPCSPASQLLNGASNRHYIAKQLGAYVQDDVRLSSRLMVDLGLRWDWDGPLYERNGLLTSFHPNDYSYDVATDTISSYGLVVAGNNSAFGTKGVSDSTLTGRQWGFAPRIGIVYSPSALRNVVVRAGFGLYYDRGEYFTELSSPAGNGISGPFGVTVEEPFVVPYYAVANGSFASPFGSTPPPPPPSSLAGVESLIPNAAGIISGDPGFFFGGYDPSNKLPYSENWTLDLQWQPKNNLVFSLGYVGNHGVHQVIPLPFNQAKVATPQNPALKGGPYEQDYSYGYNLNCYYIYPTSCSSSNLLAEPTLPLQAENLNTLVDGYETGNVALRSSYIGYDPNSVFSRAVGMSNYNALQFNVSQRVTHGLMVTGSYTYSHTLDEQSGLGLFFSGNDPNDPRSSYGSSDFDRTHVLTVSYVYQLPGVQSGNGWLRDLADGWSISGVTDLQSGQPYSVIDYSGGAGSIFWGGGQDAVTNPIVPVGGYGSSATNAVLQGTTGVNGTKPVLNAAAFGVPTPYAPGTNGVPACDPTSDICDNWENGYAAGGRNIFRAPFQERWDIGLAKDFKLTEKFDLKYDVEAFNIFNHPSFDIPNNDVSFNPGYCNPPGPNYSCSTIGYAFPPYGHLGNLTHTIGSPRFIQMALHLSF
jgi:hypothetical protein